MTVTTNYTKSANIDTLKGGTGQAYRVLHWITDVLKNFFSDPINIKDERLRSLLYKQDGNTDETLNALFKIEAPFNPDSKKACTTPSVIVSVSDITYADPGFNLVGFHKKLDAGGDIIAAQSVFHKIINININILTESYEGTLLLSELICDFLQINKKSFLLDNKSVNGVVIQGLKGPDAIEVPNAFNAKPLYMSNLLLQVSAGVSNLIDTQGPTFRGVKQQLTIV